MTTQESGGTRTILSAPADAPVPVGAAAPVMNVLPTMRAMRRLKPDPVPRELLEQLVEAATWAPNGGNLQLYSYIVVTDRAQMARLGALWREVSSKYLTVAQRTRPDLATDPTVVANLNALRHQAEHFDDPRRHRGVLLATGRPSRHAPDPRCGS